ncbi:hypothetical protein NDU88_007123 [Pleurodeles waltl]|uniref:Uncharacterized protein n=1 Tax=Pleurodeles waltl TaxID=8319 RepID=A0AAV7MPB5_PLEWA|nr:hypothetical protein NDU88_007123 [Pleurodeles waltl]
MRTCVQKEARRGALPVREGSRATGFHPSSARRRSSKCTLPLYPQPRDQQQIEETNRQNKAAELLCMCPSNTLRNIELSALPF